MKALYNISYGLYVLTANAEKPNGCIINTLQQVTSNPERISITVNKDNYTTKLIEETGIFNVCILDINTNFETIKNFGFSSGKDVDKFEKFKDFKLSKNGLPYITKNTNAFLSAKVVSKTDVGTHFTFVADVTEDVVLSETESITYSYYLKNVKPKPEPQNKNQYVCSVCGYVHEGENLPEDFICPICKHGAEVFELQK
ncbi:MAG: flavin reductase [Clostridia bacterium]|nr:flavin reductase [Clostridia bacterium]